MYTEVGRHSIRSPHHNNQDACQAYTHRLKFVAGKGRGELFVVVDGASSSKASGDAAGAAVQAWRQLFTMENRPDFDAFKAIAQSIDRDVAAMSGRDEDDEKPVAAMTALWLHPSGTGYFAHVGDTVGYRMLCDENSSFMAFTADHSDGHALMRYLGKDDPAQFQFGTFPIEPGETFVLVSDGVPKGLEVDRIRALAMDDVEEGAHQIVVGARKRGSTDDITALVIYLDDFEDE